MGEFLGLEKDFGFHNYVFGFGLYGMGLLMGISSYDMLSYGFLLVSGVAQMSLGILMSAFNQLRGTL